MDADLLVTQLVLSRIFNCSQPQINLLVRKGMPRVEGDSNKQTRYYLPEVIKWYVQHKTIRT